jgi:ergothioneine biosynthesis protein EgtB
LAHTTWFFETFVLEPFAPGYASTHPRYRMLFNSYYEAVGPKHPRPLRGMLTRPTVDEIYAYRRRVDEAVSALLRDPDAAPQIAERVELGLHHEQQHQELLLTDLQHAFAMNPLLPVYRERISAPVAVASAPRYRSFEGGLQSIGDAGAPFSFDNERPRHRVYVEPYQLAQRLVTQGDYLAFIADDGYRRPELWLADGFAFVQRHAIEAPLYWRREGDERTRYSLHGEIAIDPAAPVCHVSYYEADAFARWAQARLPSEAEWELAYARSPVAGQFVGDPGLVPEETGLGFGSVWAWTASPYVAYPGFRYADGALGEYNAKFMSDQWVLRGGSCFTPRDSMRATYRNFFPAGARWQVSGIRLARDA